MAKKTSRNPAKNKLSFLLDTLLFMACHVSGYLTWLQRLRTGSNSNKKLLVAFTPKVCPFTCKSLTFDTANFFTFDVNHFYFYPCSVLIPQPVLNVVKKVSQELVVIFEAVVINSTNRPICIESRTVQKQYF